jgi:hypothetical protein
VAAYEPGSFRDPDSAAFASGGRIRRGLSAQGPADWELLAPTAFFGRLCDSGQTLPGGTRTMYLAEPKP